MAFNTSNQPIVPGQALNATDNLGVFCWQKDSNSKAQGDINVFQDLGNPQYYGDIYSGVEEMGESDAVEKTGKEF